MWSHFATLENRECVLNVNVCTQWLNGVTRKYVPSGSQRVRGRFCPPGGIWQCLEPFTVVTVGQCCWHLHGSGPGMLLNILQCTGQSSTAKNWVAPNVSNAVVEKPWVRWSVRYLPALKIPIWWLLLKLLCFNFKFSVTFYIEYLIVSKFAI